MRFIFRKFFQVLFISLFLFGSFQANAKDSWQEVLADAQVALDANDYKKAIKKYEKALKLDPPLADELDIAFVLGSLYFIRRDYKKAAPKFDLAIELLENKISDVTRLALAYGQRAQVADRLDDSRGANSFQAKADALDSQQIGDSDEIWSLNEATGLLTHNRTKSEFPFEFYGFERIDNHSYNDQGSDVSVTYYYNGDSSKGVFTTYLSYYTNATLAAYVDATKTSVFSRSPTSMRTISESQYLRPQSETNPQVHGAFRGRYAYALNDSLSEMATEIWIAQEQDFFLKFRLTYPMAVEAEITKATEELLEHSDFLISHHLLALVASEKFDLPLCLDADNGSATSPTLFENLDTTMVVGVLIEVVGKLIGEEQGDLQKCIIDMNGGTNYFKLVNILYLENEGTQTPLYDLALYSEGWKTESAFSVTPSAILPELMEKAGEKPGPYYFLTRKKENVVEFFEVYQGKPGIGEVKQHLIEILAGQRTPKVRTTQDEEGNTNTELLVGFGDLGSE